jgi:hypothetical protein
MSTAGLAPPAQDGSRAESRAVQAQPRPLSVGKQLPIQLPRRSLIAEKSPSRTVRQFTIPQLALEGLGDQPARAATERAAPSSSSSRPAGPASPRQRGARAKPGVSSVRAGGFGSQTARWRVGDQSNPFSPVRPSEAPGRVELPPITALSLADPRTDLREEDDEALISFAEHTERVAQSIRERTEALTGVFQERLQQESATLNKYA